MDTDEYSDKIVHGAKYVGRDAEHHVFLGLLLYYLLNVLINIEAL